jgi:hypothetical protein
LALFLTVSAQLSETAGKAFLHSCPYSSVSVKIRTEIKSLAGRDGNGLIGPVGNSIRRLAYLHVEPIFTVLRAEINDCVVSVGKHRFLICAHYSPTAPVNWALKDHFPGFEWRGELVVVALGERRPLEFVSVARTKKAVLRRALNRYDHFLLTALCCAHLAIGPKLYLVFPGESA